MLSFLAGKHPRRTTTAHLVTLSYENGASSQRFHKPSDEYLVTQTLPPSTTPTFFIPPLHFHINQAESFFVRSGSGRFYLGNTSTVLDAGATITIPVGAYHRFENASTSEPLVVDLKLDPKNWEQEVSFFRNFFGYLEDCRVTGISPNPLQIMRFLHAGEAPMAFPIPGPQWLRNTIDQHLVWFLGCVVGEGLFGFKDSYPEYYKRSAE